MCRRWGLVVALCALLSMPTAWALPASAQPLVSTSSRELPNPEVSRGPHPAMRFSSGAFFVAGDSVTFDTWWWGRLPFRAQRQGWQVSGVRAHGGLRAAQLAAMWPQFSDSLPGVVLIAIGANDVMHGTQPRNFRRSVERVIGLSPGRKIILVSIFARSDPLLAGRERALNAVLRGLARARHRVTYANWGRVVETHPDWPLPSDVFRIHLTPQGINGRARFYIDVMDRAYGR